MIIKKPGPLCILFFLFCTVVQAQPKQVADSSVHRTIDSSQQVAEAYLLRQRAQQRVDSVIAAQLQNELSVATNNARRRKQLEDSLRILSRRETERKTEQLARISELKRHAVAYPVVLLSDTLFYLYTRIGSFTAAERAQAVSERISKLYDDAFFNADSLQVISDESTYDIVYKQNEIVMSITDLDALWFNQSPDKLAQDYLIKIKTEIGYERKENSVWSWVLRIAYILLVIAGIWLIIFGINRLFRRVTRVLRTNKEKYFKGFQVRKVQLLTPEQHYHFAMRANNALRLLVIFLAIYLALPLLFGILPQTKPMAAVLWYWTITPIQTIVTSFLHFLPKLFTIVVIYMVTRYLVKIVRYFASEVDKGNIVLNGFYKDWAWPTYNVIRFFIYAFMLVIVYPYLPGSNSDAFKGVSVFLGVLLSLGSSSAISNIIAGLVITYMRPFRIGDRVKIGDVVGDVVEKTMLVTRVRTIKNEDITVPNSTILNNHTINYSANAKETGLIVHTTVTIGYSVPWKDMHQALIDAALQTEFILPQPLPFVLQTSLDDFFVSYQINAYTKEANQQALIYSLLHQNIQDVCNERGIEIMSPHYSAMRDGNTTTIPPDDLPKDYKAPGFNVNIRQYRAGQ